MAANVLFCSGSIRQDSYNRKLIKLAYEAALKEGVTAKLIDLRDFPMPIYDGDIEAKEGLPENAKRLKEIFKNHDGFILACPEYNASITPLLKNALDWISRKEPQDPAASVAYEGKVAGIISATPSGMGGLRTLRHVREILNALGVLVVPTQTGIAKAHEAFNADGTLKDSKQLQAVESVVKDVARVITKLKA